MTPGSNNEKIVLYDGYCRLCSWSVRFIKRNDVRATFRYEPLQDGKYDSLIKEELERNHAGSVILINGSEVSYQSDAALKIVKHLRFPVKLLYIFYFIPRFIRDPLYRFIARNRYRWFGKRETCYIN